MRHRMKSVVLSTRGVSLPLIRSRAFGQRHLLTCLNYHRVVPGSQAQSEGCVGKGISVSVESFEEQMRYLSTHVRCLSSLELVENLHAHKLEDDCVHVTFDDGYLDNLQFALPILEHYRVPATIFVTVGFVDGTVIPWWHELEGLLSRTRSIEYGGRRLNVSTAEDKQRVFSEICFRLAQESRDKQRSAIEQIRLQVSGGDGLMPRFLTWDELRKLDNSSMITIGAHTWNHPVLSTLSQENLEYELGQAKQRLQRELGHEVSTLAYPFGGKAQSSEREFSMARSLGYRAAFTMRFGHILFGHRSYPVALPRVPIVWSDDMTDFAWKLWGFEALRRHWCSQLVFD